MGNFSQAPKHTAVGDLFYNSLNLSRETQSVIRQAFSNSVTFKPHSSIGPNQTGFLQRAVSKAPRPRRIRPRLGILGRGASDT